MEDILAAMLLQAWDGFEIFNVSTGDHVTVSDIAQLFVERMALDAVEYEYTGRARGILAATAWK